MSNRQGVFLGAYAKTKNTELRKKLWEDEVGIDLETIGEYDEDNLYFTACDCTFSKADQWDIEVKDETRNLTPEFIESEKQKLKNIVERHLKENDIEYCFGFINDSEF